MEDESEPWKEKWILRPNLGMIYASPYGDLRMRLDLGMIKEYMHGK